MIRNYFKIAFRNLWKDRTFTSLNIIGLTVAFGVAILLGMFGVFQLSFDRFHEHKDQLYLVYSENRSVDEIEANTAKS
ncbi:MAG: hypothetical protein ABIO60_07735, partial [Aquaticitalea sp.]